MPCRLLNCRTVASFKGQNLYLFKHHVLKKIYLLKGCAISDPYLMLCSHCCLLHSSFITKWTPCLSHRCYQGSGTGVDPQVALLDEAFCASLLLLRRIKSSTAGILLHGMSSLYWFVSNSTNKVLLVVIVP